MTGARKRDPLAFIAAELDELKAKHLYRPLRVMSAAQGPVTVVDGRRGHLALVERLPGPDPPPEAPRRGPRRRGRVRRRLRRRQDDRRHDGRARAARGGARRVQGRRGGAHVPVRLHREHGRHPDDHRRGGPDRVRRAQPRLDHRRHAPLEGAAQGLPAQGRRGTARDPPRGRREGAAGRVAGRTG